MRTSAGRCSTPPPCWDRPAAVRYPRGAGPALPIAAEIHRAAARHALRCAARATAASRCWRSAACSTPALSLAEQLDATVVNMRFIKPLDVALLREIASTHAGPRDARGERRRRRRRQRLRRSARCRGAAAAAAAHRHPGPLHRARQSRGLPGRGGAGRGRHRCRDRELARTTVPLLEAEPRRRPN